MDALENIAPALATRPVVMLATVIGTSGSTPAAALSRMLVGAPRERLAGTIGGGCIEADVIAAADGLAASGRSAVMTFTLTEDHPESGMLCGGTLDVFIEPLVGSDVPFVSALINRRDAGEESVRGTVCAADGNVLGRFLYPLDRSGSIQATPGADPARTLPEILRPHAGTVIQAVADLGRPGGARRIQGGESMVVLEHVGGAPSLLLFGGGHVSLAVCRIAAMAGFRVTIIDDRPEFASAERFPDAAKTLASDFVGAFAHLNVRPSSSIVIVTRGHKADEVVLEEAVKTDAGYIGMIGSRKKVAAAFERLTARGVPAGTLRRVHAPVGVDIGASTPEEIAVSIVAELIHSRRVPGAPLRFKSDNFPVS